MKDATISELYDLTQTIAAKIFEGKTYPWEVLPLIKDFILELGETLDPAEYEKRGENVWIAKDAVIADNFHGMYLMTEYLYEHETITGKEFMKIFRELKGIPEPGQETEAAVSDDMFVDDEV